MIGVTPDALPPSPPIIIVESAPNHSPLVMMGFAATGDDTSLARLEAAARRVALPNQRVPAADERETELAVMFPPGGARALALSLYHSAMAGAFGRLKVEVMVIGLDAYQRGADIADTAQAVPPNFIVDPKN